MPHYDVPLDLADDINNRFTYHAPINDQAERYERLRNDARRLALSIAERTPSSREQSLALTHLETAIFFANAAIARNEVAVHGKSDYGDNQRDYDNDASGNEDEDDDLPF